MLNTTCGLHGKTKDGNFMAKHKVKSGTQIAVATMGLPIVEALDLQIERTQASVIKRKR